MSTVLLPVFPGVPAWSGLRLLAGISCALVWVVVESALLRAGTLQTRGILLASYMVVYYLGTVLGQLLLGWFPSDMPLIVTEVCILSVAGMVPLMFARLEPGNGQVSSSSHIEIRTLLRRRSVFWRCGMCDFRRGIGYYLLPDAPVPEAPGNGSLFRGILDGPADCARHSGAVAQWAAGRRTGTAALSS